MALIASSLSFSSCSKDEEDSNRSEVENSPIGNTTEKIKNRELFGYWDCEYTTDCPDFYLYSDGTGTISIFKNYENSNDGRWMGTDITWSYDTGDKVLTLSDGHKFSIKSLTSKTLSAEWKNGSELRSDTWTRQLYSWVIDPSWEKLIVGTWKEGYQTITFNNGRFTYKFQDASQTVSFSGRYYTESNGTLTIQLESDETYNIGTYDNPQQTTRVLIEIHSINGNLMDLYFCHPSFKNLVPIEPTDRSGNYWFCFEYQN